MNNKQLGTEFEQEVVEWLSSKGYWVHFIVPDNRGAQPFDIIAVKDTIAYAIDCKTSARRVFSIDRLEDNQKTAFELWERCNNTSPMVFVKHKGYVYPVFYWELKYRQKIDLLEDVSVSRRIEWEN